MSLRRLRRSGFGRRRGIREFLGLGRKSHLEELKKRHKEKQKEKASIIGEEKQKRKMAMPSFPALRIRSPNRISPILIIAIITILIISIEIFLWASKEEPTELLPTSIENDTVLNETAPLANESSNEDYPDFDIRSFSLDKVEATTGESIMASYKIKNEGTADATNVTINLFLFEETIAERIVNLSEKATIEGYFNWTVPEGISGPQAIWLKVDPTDLIEEEAEDDNEEGIELFVTEKMVEDISDSFILQSTRNFNEHWYSSNFKVPPASGSGYNYFEISRADSDTYHLDVVIAGFKTTKQGQIHHMEVPDSSDSGWNGRMCIRRTVDADNCIWNGPQIFLELDFDGNRISATDRNGRKKTAVTSDDDIDEIYLVGLRRADWPEEDFKTTKVYGAAEPNYLVPTEFYEFKGDRLYIHPMRWNPRKHEAVVATWLRFEIKTT